MAICILERGHSICSRLVLVHHRIPRHLFRNLPSPCAWQAEPLGSVQASCYRETMNADSALQFCESTTLPHVMDQLIFKVRLCTNLISHAVCLTISCFSCQDLPFFCPNVKSAMVLFTCLPAIYFPLSSWLRRFQWLNGQRGNRLRRRARGRALKDSDCDWSLACYRLVTSFSSPTLAILSTTRGKLRILQFLTHIIGLFSFYLPALVIWVSVTMFLILAVFF